MSLFTRLVSLVLIGICLTACSDKPKRDISQDATSFVQKNKGADPATIVPLVDRMAVAQQLDKWKIPYPRNERIVFCYGGNGCDTRRSVQLPVSVNPVGINSPEAERKYIESELNSFTNALVGVDNFNTTDQALNNTQMLSILAERGLLKYYMVQPMWQDHFWTQLYASVKEVGTGRRFVVVGSRLVESK